MELNQYISGERLQGLANISVIPLGSDNGESECSFVKDQQKNNNYKAFYYNKDTKVISDDLQNADIIFVNTWTLDKFFDIIFPLLKNNYVFISHNSDMGIEMHHHRFLNDDKVIQWFSQNAYAAHPKLRALPIGLGNRQYPHGDIQLLDSTRGFNTSKTNLVFKQFDVNTNFPVRSAIDAITASHGFGMLNPMPQAHYFATLRRSVFSISPPGNGVDCHRIWESLYLNTIPIVQAHTCLMQFEHLPILFIDDWHVVDAHFLRRFFDNLNKPLFRDNIQELDLNYWKSLIQKYIR